MTEVLNVLQRIWNLLLAEGHSCRIEAVSYVIRFAFRWCCAFGQGRRDDGVIKHLGAVEVMAPRMSGREELRTILCFDLGNWMEVVSLMR